jgi:hypothetical protein
MGPIAKKSVTTPLTVSVVGPDSELSAAWVVELDDSVDGSIVVETEVVAVVVDASVVVLDDSSSLPVGLDLHASDRAMGRIKARRDITKA